jgi:hypothetical protein
VEGARAKGEALKPIEETAYGKGKEREKVRETKGNENQTGCQNRGFGILQEQPWYWSWMD